MLAVLVEALLLLLYFHIRELLKEPVQEQVKGAATFTDEGGFVLVDQESRISVNRRKREFNQLMARLDKSFVPGVAKKRKS